MFPTPQKKGKRKKIKKKKQQLVLWEILKEKGNVEFKNKNYNAAINIYSDAIRENSEQDVLYSNRALCYKALGNYRFALNDMNKALQINPKNVKNLVRKFDIHVIMGDFFEAENTIKKCMAFEPKESNHRQLFVNNQIHLNEMNELYNSYHNCNYAKSLELSTKLKDICSGNLEVKSIYIDSLICENRTNEAINYWSGKLTDNERSNDEMIYLIAKCFYYEGNYEKAKTSLKNLLKRTNDNNKYNKLYQNVIHSEEHKEKANNIFKSGNYQEAINEYTKLIEIDPQNKNFNSTIIANRALCYQKLGKDIDALDDMNKALELNTKYVKGFLRRANINMNLGNFEQAKYDFNRVLELEPHNQEAKVGKDNATKKEKEAKKKDYYKVLEIPRDADEGKIRKAYKVLALKHHPDKNSQSETQRAQAEKKFKEITEAYEVLSDPKKKQMFDNGIDPNDQESGGGFHNSNINPHDIFASFFGGGGGGFDDFGGFGGSPFETFHQGGGGKKSSKGGQTFFFKFG